MFDRYVCLIYVDFSIVLTVCQTYSYNGVGGGSKPGRVSGYPNQDGTSFKVDVHLCNQVRFWLLMYLTVRYALLYKQR